MATMLFDTFASAAHTRLLVLTVLLLCTTVLAEADRAGRPTADSWSSVFAEPPAYLHPRSAIGFDVSGLPAAPPGGVEAALLASLHGADLHTRAHAHMSLAVYYKLRGMSGSPLRKSARATTGSRWRGSRPS